MRHVAAIVVDHLGFAIKTGQAGRRLAAEIAAQPRVNRHGSGFSRAIDLQHRQAAPLEAFDQRHRHLRRARRYGTQATRCRFRCHCGCCKTACMTAGTISTSVGRSSASAFSIASGAKRVMDGDRRAKLQGRCGLDVEPADMKHRQHGEDVIVRPHVMQMMTHQRRSRSAPPAAAPRLSAGPWCRTYRPVAADWMCRYAGCGRRRCRRRPGRRTTAPAPA